MSCRFLHWWRKLDREKVGTYYQDTYACRWCAATKTEYQRQGEKDDQGVALLHKILQVFVFSVMLWAIFVRLILWADTQPVIVEQNSPTPAPEDTRPLDYFNPYSGN